MKARRADWAHKYNIEKGAPWPERFCVAFVWLVFVLILLFLTGISLSFTCRVYGAEEIIRYERDYLIMHLIAFLFVVALGVFCRLRGYGPGRIFRQRKFCIRIMVIMAMLGALWVAVNGFWIISDQRMVFESAQAFLRGDYRPWAPVGYGYSSESGVLGYAYTYPSQNGLILFFSALAVFFHGLTPYAVQLLNVLFFIVGNIFVCKLLQATLGEASMNGTALLLIGFLPFYFYVTFVYGTISGFACASAALFFEYRFLQMRRWRDMAVSAFLICGATLLKSNYLIVLTAMVIYLITFSLFRRRLCFFGAAVLLVFLYIGSGRVVNFYLEKTIGVPVEGGIPMLAWVEMGLMEGSRGAGWFNGYNVQVFSANESNSEGALAAIRKDLQETIETFKEDPEYAADFFIRKTASIWAEPTFQSLWIQEVKGDSWLFPRLTESLFDEGGLLNRIYVAVFNYVQTLVYVGALLFLFLRRRSITWLQLMPAVIFIGGFFFHMVWEAKGQYTVCYFVLLIPYAVIGFKALMERWSARIQLTV